MLHVLVFLVSLGARTTRAACRRRADLVLENLALRQQVTALKKERPRPPLEARFHHHGTAPGYLTFDRASIFGAAVVEFIRATGTRPVRTSFRSPWQNGTAERWILSCGLERLDHVVIFGERHLVRLVRSYICYYHEDRCHLGLSKDTPNARAITP